MYMDKSSSLTTAFKKLTVGDKGITTESETGSMKPGGIPSEGIPSEGVCVPSKCNVLCGVPEFDSDAVCRSCSIGQKTGQGKTV